MIYLDANATSRLREGPRVVLEKLIREDACVRNPSSIHGPGRKARALLTEARRNILKLLFSDERSSAQVIFGSGGTEACNQMVFGFLGPTWPRGVVGEHILSSSIEHPAVMEPLGVLERAGYSVSRVAPDTNGQVSVNSFLEALSDETALVVLMAANNETGVLQPVCAIARELRSQGYSGPIVSDITQAVGKTGLSFADFFASGVNALALSGHKLGAPAGIGALVLSGEDSGLCFEMQAYLMGGPQEQRMRAGTENLLGIVGFGEAAREISRDLSRELETRTKLRDRLWSHLAAADKSVFRLGAGSGDGEMLLSNTLLVRFCELRGDDLVVALDLNGVAASTGSACASGKQGASHVLHAMGLSEDHSREAVRFSLDWDSDEKQIDMAAEIIHETVAQMRRSNG